MTVSISTIKDRFISGKFVLHCPVIELEQCGVTSAAKTYVGSGAITLDPRAGFMGSFVTAPMDLFTQLMIDQELVVGEIVPDSYFYRLRATAVDGTIWINPKVEISLQSGTAGTLVTFEPNFLAMSRPAVDASRTAAAFVFFDTLPFPLTGATHTIQKGPGGEQTHWKRDGGRQRTGKMDLTYREWNEGPVHCEFTVTLAEPAPLGFENRLLEALRFATAVPASWVMLEYNQGGHVHLELSPYRPPQHHMVNAPLRASEQPQDFFRLLEAFYVHACGNTTGEEFSQLSTAIGPLFALKGLDMAAISLVIGVAIEALLKEEFSDLEGTDPALVADVRAMEKMIASMTAIPMNTRNRMKGAIGSIKSTRAQDKLGKLERMGLVTSAEIEHWKKLRNTSAHGSLRVDPEQMQQHLQRLYSVTTMAYKLAFLRIGYFGPYTDYGAPRWPIAWFPHMDDARTLSRVTEQLAQLLEADVEDKLYAWKAVDSALRTTFREHDAGASRVAAALVLLAAMMKAAALRLAQLRSKNALGTAEPSSAEPVIENVDDDLSQEIARPSMCEESAHIENRQNTIVTQVPEKVHPSLSDWCKKEFGIWKNVSHRFPGYSLLFVLVQIVSWPICNWVIRDLGLPLTDPLRRFCTGLFLTNSAVIGYFTFDTLVSSLLSKKRSAGKKGTGGEEVKSSSRRVRDVASNVVDGILKGVALLIAYAVFYVGWEGDGRYVGIWFGYGGVVSGLLFQYGVKRAAEFEEPAIIPESRDELRKLLELQCTIEKHDFALANLSRLRASVDLDFKARLENGEKIARLRKKWGIE